MSLTRKTAGKKQAGVKKKAASATAQMSKKPPTLDRDLTPLERQQQRMRWLSSKESGQRPSVTDVVIQRIFSERQAAYKVLPGIVPEDQRVETIARIDEWDRFPMPQ